MKNQKSEIKNVPLPSRAFVMPVCRVLAGVIRRRRVRAGLSLNWLAALAGVTRQMLGKVEADECVPTTDVQARIAGALGLPLSRLVAVAERWLDRSPAECRACNYSCMAQGRLKWWNARRGCTRPKH